MYVSLIPAALAAQLQAFDASPIWEIIKGIALFASTSMLAWCATMLRQVLTRQTRVDHFLFGVDGDNGLRSMVKDIREDVDAVLERNLRIDAVVDEQERHQYKGPDRRAGARRLRDVVHDAQDERFHQTHEHQKPEQSTHKRRSEDRDP